MTNKDRCLQAVAQWIDDAISFKRTDIIPVYPKAKYEWEYLRHAKYEDESNNPSSINVPKRLIGLNKMTGINIRTMGLLGSSYEMEAKFFGYIDDAASRGKDPDDEEWLMQTKKFPTEYLRKALASDVNDAKDNDAFRADESSQAGTMVVVFWLSVFAAGAVVVVAVLKFLKSRSKPTYERAMKFVKRVNKRVKPGTRLSSQDKKVIAQEAKVFSTQDVPLFEKVMTRMRIKKRTAELDVIADTLELLGEEKLATAIDRLAFKEEFWPHIKNVMVEFDEEHGLTLRFKSPADAKKVYNHPLFGGPKREDFAPLRAYTSLEHVAIRIVDFKK